MAFFKRILRFLAILFVILCLMLYFLQEKLIFYSSQLPHDYQYEFIAPFEELFLSASDGALLNGLHFKQENPKGIILYSHGNAGQLDAWGAWAEELSNRYHYDVLIWDYRGYGKSKGKRRQDLMLNDGLLFYTYCLEHFKEDQILLFGRSLGTFFTTHMAQDRHPKKIILESGPTSLLDMAKKVYPILPANLLLKFRFENLSNLSQLQIPISIIHGTRDQLVPFDHAQSLFETAKSSEKKIYPIVNAGHNDLVEHSAYFKALDEILE
ncbi:MAG: alpha/beta hydrolase [Bacteroidota bacterium]